MSTVRYFQNTNWFVLIGSLALCIIFMLQARQTYLNNQKYNRFLNYKKYVNEISTELKLIENSINKSTFHAHFLNELLYKHREKDAKIITTSEVSN